MIKVFGLLLAAACLAVGQCYGTDAATNNPAALLDKGGKILDVRSPAEFAGGHLPGAINVPVDQLESRITTVVPDKATPLLVHCRSGGRSAKAIPILQKLGYATVLDLGSLEHAKKVCAPGK